jgi:hypothetical protein
MTTIDILNSLVERGLATPVKSADAFKMNYNGVLPNKYDWGIINHWSMDISIPFDLFQKHIGIILSRIDGVKYSWDNSKCAWDIEYGTIPIEKTKKGLEYQQVMKGKMAALQASNTAIEWFPHLVEYDDIWNDNTVSIGEEDGHWCKIELQIFRDNIKNCLFISLQRLSGDRTTHWNIWRELYPYFQGNIFLSRCSFLELVEGVEYDKEDPVHRYLFDDMLVREFSTFMQHG